MSGNSKIIRDFIAAWGRNDIDEIMGFFAEDCVYHNIPVAPVTGQAAVRATIEGYARLASEIEWVLHRIAETAAGDVLTERTDRFKIADRWVELPVMGSFELRGGKIDAWRDYFDMAQFQKQLPSSD